MSLARPESRRIRYVKRCVVGAAATAGGTDTNSGDGAFESDIYALLEREPKITSIRIAQLLREKHASFVLGERAVRKYIARRRGLLHPKDMFIRQFYVPGDPMQYDFRDVKAIVGGEEIDLHLFMARLRYSTAWFARCYRTEDRPALFDGLTRTGPMRQKKNVSWADYSVCGAIIFKISQRLRSWCSTPSQPAAS